MSLKTMKEVTRLTSITENALRYYNAKGILSPTVREETGRKQWLYDDVAITKLKKLFLLKSIGVSLEEIKTAIHQEEQFWEVIMQRLEQLRKEQDELDLKIFIARILLMSRGEGLFQPEVDSDEVNTAVLNELIREYLKESVKDKENIKK